MTAKEMIDLLNDSVREGKLDGNSQVTVMDYDHKGHGLKRLDVNYYKLNNKQITFSSFQY